MWRCLFLCVACTSASTPPPVAQPRPAPTPPPPAPADQMLARVAYQNTNGWLEIAIDGTDDKARKWCEAMLARIERRQMAPLTIVVERRCAPTQLPPARRRGYVFAARDELDVLTKSVLDVELADAASITGSTTHFNHFETAAACEHHRSWVAEETAKNRADSAVRVAEFMTRQLEIAERDAKRACDEATAAAAKPCRGDRFENIRCTDGRRAAEQNCDFARERVSMLKQRQAAPPDPAPEIPPCIALP